MQATQALTRAVQIRSRHIGTICGERTRTWGEIGDRVARLGAGLRSLGIRRGDRVAVLAHNSDRYIELFFAINWAGAVIVPLNTRWAIPENVYALKDCEPSALFYDDEYAETVAQLQTQRPVQSLVYMGDKAAPEGHADYEALIRSSAPMADACGSNDELAFICYTGGTTGFPKGVMLSHTNIVFGLLNWIASYHHSDETVFLHAAAYFHLAGAWPAMAVTMCGGTHVVLEKFQPEFAFEAIQKHRVNHCLFVPTMINILVNHPQFNDYDLSSVKDCIYGASPISDAVQAVVLKKLPTWRFIQGYGMTETSAVNLTMPWRYHFDGKDHTSKRLGTGRAAYGVDIRIVDPQGNELPRGETGEIAIRGPQVMLGYWRNPEATAATIRDGWLFSGDAAWMDEDGFVNIVDRKKDMIISGGENVYSREVENAISLHPAVLECVVIGIPDKKWGEAVHAVIVPKPDHVATSQEIIDHCHKWIAGYKCPRSVEFRQSMPISTQGKLQKNLLRDPYWAGQRRAVT